MPEVHAERVSHATILPPPPHWQHPRPRAYASFRYGRRQRRHPQPGHPAPVQPRNGQPGGLHGDRLTDRRQVAEVGHDEPGRGLVRALVQLDAGELLEVGQVEQTVDLHLAGEQPPSGRPRDVVLVADVADDLLDQVLEGDDAVGAAVLVDDDGEVLAGPAHLRQRRQHLLGRRQGRDLADDLGDLGRRCVVGREQVAQVQEADHVVVRGAEHRVARVRRRAGQRGGLRDGELTVEEVDLGARHHHLVELALARGEDLVDEPPLVTGQRLVGGDQAAQLLLGDGLAVGVGVAAEQPDDHVGGLGQEPDDGPLEPRKRALCSRQSLPPLVALQSGEPRAWSETADKPGRTGR